MARIEGRMPKETITIGGIMRLRREGKIETTEDRKERADTEASQARARSTEFMITRTDVMAEFSRLGRRTLAGVRRQAQITDSTSRGPDSAIPVHEPEQLSVYERKRLGAVLASFKELGEWAGLNGWKIEVGRAVVGRLKQAYDTAGPSEEARHFALIGEVERIKAGK